MSVKNYGNRKMENLEIYLRREKANKKRIWSSTRSVVEVGLLCLLKISNRNDRKIIPKKGSNSSAWMF
jgi:hypothetical protein